MGEGRGGGGEKDLFLTPLGATGPPPPPPPGMKRRLLLTGKIDFVYYDDGRLRAFMWPGEEEAYYTYVHT